MSNFKIIAIKTGDRFNIEKEESTNILLDPIKILNYNTVYSFYSDYGFPNNDFNKIIDNSKEDELYSLKTSINNIPVNINAIVGSNGSGKSTLIELLYWINYNIGCQFKLLKNEHDKLYKLFKFLELEILYSIDDGVFVKLKFEKGKIYKQLLNKNKKEITPEGEEIQIKKITDLSDFFYTVVINYSHYSLNSLEVGKWITPLFHKNDGYQTPIVLNPMRTDGKIDINRERHLLTRRLLANILEDIGDQEEEDSLRNLVNCKIANKIKLTYNSSLECNFKDSIAPTLLKEFLEGIKTHFNILVTEDDLRDNVFLNASLKYIFQKLDKVARVYRPFKKHIEGNSIKWLKSYFEKIKYSNSHIVFKIKGAILFLKYFNKITEIDQFNPKEAIILKVDKYSNLISKIDKQEDFWVNTFMLAPPPLFDVEIIPKDESSFEALSSGEKQRIHSISSIVYHLIN
jgi:energy-coupling factor transporter ATP-binding protein EcfA2